MIYKLIGQFDERISLNSFSLNVNGVCYMIHARKEDIDKIAMSKSCRIYIHEVFAQESLNSFYGFLDKQYLEWFLELLKITKIGPKICLRIVSQLTIEEFEVIVKNQDTKSLTKIEGIGPKTAIRLVNETLNCVQKLLSVDAKKSDTSSFKDAKATLSSLGYDMAVINEKFSYILSNIKNVNSDEAMIKKFLELNTD